MKAITTHYTKLILAAITLFLTCLCGPAVHAAPPAVFDFSLTARNFTQVNDRTFEFDLYLLDTDAAQPFQLASVQCGLTVNTAIFAGGTLSVLPVAGTSALATLQAPQHATFITGNGADVIRLAGENPPGNGNGTVISTVSPGTRIIRLRVVSTVPFPQGSLANLAFVSAAAVAPSYATRIAAYQAGTNVQLDVTPGVNATVVENPVLNAGFPAAFNMTGGGSCCPSAAGLALGLSGSQTGVTYTLLNNGTAVAGPVAGTGSAFNFAGFYPAGHYTVTATNASGTVTMPNSKDILYYPAPVTTAALNTPICAGATLNLTGGPSGMSAYAWTGPNGFSSVLQNPTIATASVAASGTYTLTATNSYGCAVSASANATVNPLPVPTVTGPTSVCTNTTGVTYFTETGKSGYNWTVTGGWIASGTGTSSIQVNWGGAGPGSVSVNYANPTTCAAASATVVNVTVSVPPVLTRSLTNLTITTGQTSCKDALQTITVAGGGTTWVVNSGGTAYLVAGVNVLLEPGARVLAGGYAHAYISTDCAYCNAPKSTSTFIGTGEEPEASAAEVAPGEISIYPNPAHDRITFDFSRISASGETATVYIYNLQGRLVREFEVSSSGRTQTDISGLARGLYPVRITCGKDYWVKKIVTDN